MNEYGDLAVAMHALLKKDKKMETTLKIICGFAAEKSVNLSPEFYYWFVDWALPTLAVLNEDGELSKEQIRNIGNPIMERLRETMKEINKND